MTVPTSSLIAMGAAAAFCALLPIGILIWWRRTERTRLLPALWGALAFLLFARGLEMGLHYLCILSDNAVSRAILSSPWLYMLYGALTAGIFEECGRFCMYKTVMRRYDGRAAAVTAGIGHGGIEAMTVSAASMALYLVFALCWNAGDTDALLKLAGSAETAQTVAASLGKYTVGYCLLACLERVSAEPRKARLSRLRHRPARDFRYARRALPVRLCQAAFPGRAVACRLCALCAAQRPQMLS